MLPQRIICHQNANRAMPLRIQRFHPARGVTRETRAVENGLGVVLLGSWSKTKTMRAFTSMPA